MSSAPTRPPMSPPGPRPGGAPPSAPSSKLNVAIDPVKLLRQNWLWLGLAGVMGIGLGIVAHFALLFTTPVFAARAYFEAVGVIENVDDAQDSIGSSEDEIERFIQSQVQTMMSDEILRSAAENPRVRQETQWSKKYTSNSGEYDPVEAYLALKDIVSVRAIPETNFITMSVTAGKKNDAVTIASVVSAEYQEKRRRESQQAGLDITQSLTNQLNGIQEENLLIQDRMRRLLRDNNLSTLDEKLTKERAEIQALLPVLQETRYSLGNLREQLAIYEEQLSAPGGANYPELIRSIVRQDPVIQTFVRRVADYKASLRTARESLGPNHRSVTQLEQTIASTEDEMAAQEQALLAEKFVEYIEGMRTQIRTLQTIEAESVARLEDAEARQSEIQAILEDYNTLKGDLDRLGDRETELEARISEANAIQGRRDAERIRVAQAPRPDERPVFPKLIIVVPGVTILVVGFVGGLIFLRELLEQRVRGPADLALIPRLRIAGVIPDLSEDPSRPPAIETAVLDRPDGVISEAVRNTRAEILKRFGHSGHKTLLIASGMPGSGSTSFAVNFARSCASCELRTLVVDANFRRPGVHKATGASEEPGLSDVLSGDTNLTGAVQSGDTPGLDVLAVGSAGRRKPEHLITASFQRLLDEARENYDIVIIDAPPAIVSSDSLTLAAKCDASLLVIRAYAETRGLVTRLRSKLDEANAEFMGVIVNGVRAAAGGYFRKNYLETHRYGAGNTGAAPEPKAKAKSKKRKDASEEPEVGTTDEERDGS